MKSVKTIAIVSIISAFLFFAITQSTHEITNDVTVRGGDTVNQLVINSAREQGINLDSVDINESRDITIHESGIDAGNLRPGSVVTVTVVYRK